ncbi:MAG TPA: FkbM family methyltransferase [Acetobacteraceae bacterium]|nr:FkbM family methyltransferase [Acetobacteraceae bacterium]
MPRPRRKIAFVLAASDHGTMIVNRFDYHMVSPTAGYGVGFQILETASYDLTEVEIALRLLEMRRQYRGDGVVGIDCGANIGVHAVEWARHMSQWGAVLAIEPQEPVYYALAGNLAINNCFNARALHAAAGATNGSMRIPRPDYLVPASFGSLELRQTATTEFIGQAIDYQRPAAQVRALTLDSLGLSRVDLLKIDVEGMELDVLDGARELIGAQHPIMIIEQAKIDRDRLGAVLDGWGYRRFSFGLNVLAVHADDPSGSHISVRDNP